MYLNPRSKLTRCVHGHVRKQLEDADPVLHDVIQGVLEDALRCIDRNKFKPAIEQGMADMQTNKEQKERGRQVASLNAIQKHRYSRRKRGYTTLPWSAFSRGIVGGAPELFMGDLRDREAAECLGMDPHAVASVYKDFKALERVLWKPAERVSLSQLESAEITLLKGLECYNKIMFQPTSRKACLTRVKKLTGRKEKEKAGLKSYRRRQCARCTAIGWTTR